MSRALIGAHVALLISAVAVAQTWRDPSPHRATFVDIEQGLALESLDWGGSGPPLMLLAGLGDTAHVFDEFALRFIDRYHVVGITRRGYGASGRPEGRYDIATLANDIRAVCDRLGIDHVILIGHSLAGDEMTRLAATWSDHVGALVYLDAAYDRTNLPPQGTGPRQSPRPEDLASLTMYGRFIERTRGITLPEAELRSTVVMNADGAVLRSAVPSTTGQAILLGLERPDYTHVRAPALAIYQANALHDTFPDYQHFSDSDRARAERAIAETQPFLERSADQFQREVAHGRVLRLKTGSHYLFLTNQNEVVTAIREFLASVQGP